MPLELIDGKLVKVDTVIPTSETATLPQTEIDAITKTVKLETAPLEIPPYVPTDKNLVVQRYLSKLQQEMWDTTINKWKVSATPTAENLAKTYREERSIHFFNTDTLIPSQDPNFITENRYAIGDQVSVENVVNCTGGIIEGKHKLGFHILGFTKIGNVEEPITQEDAKRVQGYVDQVLDILGEPPTKITLIASTLGKGIDNLDLGHAFVEDTFRQGLSKRYPDQFPDPSKISISRVRSLKLSSTDT